VPRKHSNFECKGGAHGQYKSFHKDVHLQTFLISLLQVFCHFYYLLSNENDFRLSPPKEIIQQLNLGAKLTKLRNFSNVLSHD